MIYHTQGLLQIVFGDAHASFDPHAYKNLEPGQRLLDQKPFDQLKNALQISHLVFLHQVHGNQGMIISSIDQAAAIKPFLCDGDFLITNLSGVGLAVATADCLPLVLYNERVPVVAVVHAGWRGSIDNIAVKALRSMQDTFEVAAHEVRAFFGPSGKPCCYEFGPEILDVLDDCLFKEQVVPRRGGKIFFDVPLYNQLLLQEAGMAPESFNLQYNHCTMCDLSFCSHRRQRQPARQMTVVALK